jgi:hypothetical protein
MLINSSQYIVAKYLYDAFGNVLSAAGSLANKIFIAFRARKRIPTPAWSITSTATMIPICKVAK